MKMFAILLVAAVILFSGCVSNEELPPGPPANDSGGNFTANDTVNKTVPVVMTGELCKSARGSWNECGSACRGAPPGTACIAVCVPMCQCGGVAGSRCPVGFECRDMLPDGKTPDAMGICKPVKNN